MTKSVPPIDPPQGFMVWLHAVATVVFLVQIPVALLTGLKDSVPYLVFLSLWALVAAHLAGYDAARAEESGRD